MQGNEIYDTSGSMTTGHQAIIRFLWNICSNTNIEAVFDLILSHAKNNKLGQEELPNNILILSDCEFDSMVNINRGERPTNTFFDNMKIRFKNNGYILPRLVFGIFVEEVEPFQFKIILLELL
ncbi:hypothetical protein LY90DRAFT_520080 [Neocallimastix californiae]|uniref:DUF7788 domain-containing protein n=1 Tax=Neocallimastix californiae TaxID=1754190 RepID=A0A1Y1YHB7_9FUNG|nr:hypothetical protein LY90DRAFT_520080 [Neocallimastix californiae]|eukprot:ORX97431.1 hypothetical protein LY90DRAFT_520080 [Neocallimastix californiae]